MRLLSVFVPRGELALVRETLDREGFDYAVTDEAEPGEFEAIVSVPIAAGAVDPLLSALRAAGLDEESYTVVLPAEAIVSRRADPRVGGSADAESAGNFDHTGRTELSRAELRARAADLAPASSTYFALLVLSTAIATAGLLADSTATIIGAMVVAPLLGPALSAGVGVVTGDEALAARGLRLQVGGLLAAVVTAAVVGYALRGTVVVAPGLDVTAIPAVRERITPDVLALGLALGSGAAGVISLTRNVGSVLVGVAIAVALVPPAAAVGLGIAWGHPGAVLGAGTLVLVNVLAINLAALALLWLSGYRPRRPDDAAAALSTVVSRVALLAVAIAALTVVLAGITYGSYLTAAVDNDVHTELEAMDDDPEFGDLRFRPASVEYDLADLYADRRPAVTVVVERPQGEREPPGFADRVGERLEAATGTDLDVVVELVDTQRSE